VDGNRLLDMTGCFAVAAAGHGPTAATGAGAVQLGQLSAGLGDVHPTEAKVALLERLARLAPFANARTILGCNGGDAVESALKTARLTTGKPGVITFTSGYHGLNYGALAGTSWPIFREPFADQVPTWSHVATYPNPYRLGVGATEQAIKSVQAILDGPAGRSIGAILVEPIQGRGGEVVPPDDFLPRLRDLADRADVLLIFDEILCGLGRSGRLWACEHVGVAPDLLLVGKALGGGFPISACVGNGRAMAGWPISAGEAIHTYTFLGHPVGCAMACAALDQIVEHDLPARAAHLGPILLDELRKRLTGRAEVGDIRGRGLMVGIELVRDRASRQPAPQLAVATMKGCLARGLLVLAGGIDGNVLSLTPPLTVTPGQLATAAEILADALAVGGT
jgi:4-aminobutyrate aminotransferase-like enzyme